MSMTLEGINWDEIKALPREVREALTVRVFDSIRHLIPGTLGGAPCVVGGLVARGWVQQVGYRPGEPISSMMLYALAVCWMDLLPERERLLTIGNFIEQRGARQVRKYLRERGIQVGSRHYWNLVYSPEKREDYSYLAVVDYWSAFSLKYQERKITA